MLLMRNLEWWARWWRLPQKLRFLAAGAFNTIVGYLIFSALFLMLRERVYYLLIGLFAHVIAVIVAFMVYRKLVFRSTVRWLPSLLRFNVSQLLGLGFGLGFLYALVTLARWNPLAAQATVTVSSVIVNYMLHRHFSFRERNDVA